MNYLLKLTSSFSIPTSLDTTKEILIQVPADIFSAEKRDEQNGEFTIIYRAKANGEAVITSGQNKVVAKDRSSESKKTRGAIYALQNEVERLDVDSDVFYERVQQCIRRHLPEIYSQFKSEI